ncbi:MAG: TlpA family protein disulfide reductase [Anaerolineae bacterium]|nr:TlpA family protein disulfide reductase [Anaerolineae bacterium]
MKFLLILLLLFPLIPTTAQDDQTISSLSERFTVTIPEGWAASNRVMTDVQRLFASEALTIAENETVLNQVNLGPNIGGSHVVFAMFPTLEIFPLHPNPQDFQGEVVPFVFGTVVSEVEMFMVSGYPAARYALVGQPGFTLVGLGPSMLAISSYAMDETAMEIINHLIENVQISAMDVSLSPDSLTHPLTTSDSRLTLPAGAGWYFGVREDIVYTSPKASPIQDLTFGLAKEGVIEAPIFAVVPRSYAEFFEVGKVIQESDIQTVLDLTLSELEAYPQGDFSRLEVSSFPAVQVDFVLGEWNTGRAIAIDALHTIYVVFSLYPQEGDFDALVHAVFDGITVTPLTPEMAALPPEGLREGYRAPQFTATMLEGEALNLSDLQGQVVMLNFWATWCPPCREEMPTMQGYYNRYRDRGFTILAVNNRERPEEIRPYIEELGLQFPIALDGVGFIQEKYGVFNYPTSIFLDKNGIIYGVHLGPISPEQIEMFIQQGLERN